MNMMGQIQTLSFYENALVRLRCIMLENAEKLRAPILEIILILKGNMQMIYANNRSQLFADDLIVINPGGVYEVVTDVGCIFVSMQIDTEQLLIDSKSVAFDCNSANDNNKGNYYNLKHRMAQIVKINSGADQNDYLIKSMCFSIMHELTLHFQSDKMANTAASHKYAERTSRIIDYISDHYREALTLNKLAEIEHLSVPYLSSFFDKYFGVTFTTYYNEIRLTHALHDLLATDNSIESIALANGFTDPRSFVTLFKKKFSTIPSIYRKLPQEERAQQSGAAFTLKDFDKESYLQSLSKYLPSPNAGGVAQGMHFSDEKYIGVEKISMLASPKALRHTFKTFTSVGRAKELLGDALRLAALDIGSELRIQPLALHAQDRKQHLLVPGDRLDLCPVDIRIAIGHIHDDALDGLGRGRVGLCGWRGLGAALGIAVRKHGRACHVAHLAVLQQLIAALECIDR